MPDHPPVGLRGYHLGCPIWSHKAWVGDLFRTDARPAEYLMQYAQVFNTVEGNTTFYGVPMRRRCAVGTLPVWPGAQ